jgi:hypothetical protein
MFRSLYDEYYNDSDTESSNSTNSKSHSGEPLIKKLFSASQPNNSRNDFKDGRIQIQWRAGRKQMRKFMMITHIVSLKIQTWVTDYKSTDTAATTADFLLRVTATF